MLAEGQPERPDTTNFSGACEGVLYPIRAGKEFKLRHSLLWWWVSLEFVAVEEPGFSPAKQRAIEGGFSRGDRG
ncbi:MAG TPA: hypothetical protein VFB04_10380 [Terriglobales bacterium]|nr:hypothetical protein [Terriglobales bacterium]